MPIPDEGLCWCCVQVEEFAKQFPTIGFEKSQMRYKD